MVALVHYVLACGAFRDDVCKKFLNNNNTLYHISIDEVMEEVVDHDVPMLPLSDSD